MIDANAASEHAEYKVPTPTHTTVYDPERGGHYPAPAEEE